MILLLLAITLFSCAKEDTAPDTPAAPSAPSGGFTIPTTSFWRINSVNNGGSAEIVSVNVAGNNMGLNKPFPDAGYGYCQARVFFDNPNLDIRALVPEGGSIAYPITIIRCGQRLAPCAGGCGGPEQRHQWELLLPFHRWQGAHLQVQRQITLQQ
ncbi:MAG: hypothetical protein IPH05_17400 [Flavobacteriales bacterium]|nr:hypothetical protein [Flavobacteriales bacterium]